MDKRFILTILIVMSTVIFGGCSDKIANIIENNKTVTESPSYEKNITDLVKKNLQNYKAESLKIEEIVDENNSTFVHFLVNNDTLHEGLAYLAKEDNLYNLVEIDIAETDLNIPFTKHILSVLLKDGRNCRLIGGYINDKVIEEIHLEYQNNTIKVIKIGADQKTFLEYIIGDVDSLKAIIAYDKHMNEIFSYK